MDYKTFPIGEDIIEIPIPRSYKIGNNCTIGAGAVVVKDIPKNATAVGVPARILHYEQVGRFIGHPWIKRIS